VTRKRWGLVAATAVLGLALGATAVVVWQHVRPRLPTVALVTPTLDQAIALVVKAAGDDAAVTVSAFVPITGCEKTFLAKGSRYTRTADLYTNPGEEGTVVGLVAAALPASEHPVLSTRSASGTASLTADLGDGVRLQVVQVGDGWLAATAETDCRGADPAAPAAQTGSAVTQPVTALLAALGTAPTGFHSDLVTCGHGAITTLDTASQPTNTDNLAARLAPLIPPSAQRFSSPSNRVAWRQGNVSTVVASSDDGTQITVQRTTSC
jgi:hypothetical protein